MAWEYNAFPLDIIETDYGFAIYARDVTDIHHSFVVTYNFDYTKRVETTIMNNGDQPTITVDLASTSAGLFTGADMTTGISGTLEML